MTTWGSWGRIDLERDTRRCRAWARLMARSLGNSGPTCNTRRRAHGASSYASEELARSWTSRVDIRPEGQGWDAHISRRLPGATLVRPNKHGVLSGLEAGSPCRRSSKRTS